MVNDYVSCIIIQLVNLLRMRTLQTPCVENALRQLRFVVIISEYLKYRTHGDALVLTIGIRHGAV